MKLWVPGPLPGLNDLIAFAKGAGGTGRIYARKKREWTEVISLLARSAFGRRTIDPGIYPVELHFVWVEKERRRDPDNVAAAGRKLILDGLVAAGTLAGDGWAHVSGWHDDFRIGTTPGVEVHIPL